MADFVSSEAGMYLLVFRNSKLSSQIFYSIREIIYKAEMYLRKCTEKKMQTPLLAICS